MRTTNCASLLAGGPDIVQVRRRSCRAYAGVIVSLLALAAAPAYAANDIQSFVTCVNNLTDQTVAKAVACVPSDCFVTVTMSHESAQPACTLRDGTALPRVIFSCPGTGGSQTLRFRPSFTLCTQANVIKHIELGEDVSKKTRTDDPELLNFPFVQKMADIDTGLNTPVTPVTFFTLFGTAPNVPSAVIDASSPINSKGCIECHDGKGTLTVSTTPLNIANLFLPVPPLVAEGTVVTNDPAVAHPASLPSPTYFSDICTGIFNSSQLGKVPDLKGLAYSLCTALNARTPDAMIP